MGAERDRGPSQPPVTTTDLLKVAGLVFVLVDHYGLFLDESQPWWRVFGRVAAPIFFFLIGYARTRRVPFSWLAMGAALTLLDVIASEERLSDAQLNILLSFAFLRLVLPFVEREVLPHPLRLALLVALTIAAIRLIDPWLEYGTEGWLWAYFGLAHRLARENGAPRRVDTRALLLGGLAAAIYVATERLDLELGAAQTTVLAALMAILFLILLDFRRGPSIWQPAGAIARPVRFAGRHSFIIYAISLALMQIGGVVQDRFAG